MAEPVIINLRHVARGLSIPLRQVETVVELLDEGNTVPFITRYRKDQTGGLDEEHVRQIQARLRKMRLLAERKQTILRSIESQGKLTEDLGGQIRGAGTAKRLEDLYLPFKPKKQTLSTLARSRGLEPLAAEILGAVVGGPELDARAADFVSTDRRVPTAADALLGAGHILAEQFSEHAELRQRLRDVIQRTGRLVCSHIAPEGSGIRVQGSEPGRAGPEGSGIEKKENVEKPAATEQAAIDQPPPATAEGEGVPSTEYRVLSTDAEHLPKGERTLDDPPADPSDPPEDSPDPPVDPPADPPDPPADPSDPPTDPADPPADPPSDPPADPPDPPSEPPAESTPGPEVSSAASAESAAVEPGPSPHPSPLPEGEGTLSHASPLPEGEGTLHEAPASPTPAPASPSPAPASPPPAPRPRARPSGRRPNKSGTRRNRRRRRPTSAGSRPLPTTSTTAKRSSKIPPHRVLAINRGERARVLRVKLECDLEAMNRAVDEICVPPGHPHADFLRGCARDALARLILPSLEREIRRELTERAETHAVRRVRPEPAQPALAAAGAATAACWPSIRATRAAASWPRWTSSATCWGTSVIYLVGKPERRDEARRNVVETGREARASAWWRSATARPAATPRIFSPS